MSSQDVFFINAGVGLFLVALFMIRRAPRQPTVLNMRAGFVSPRIPKSTSNSMNLGRYASQVVDQFSSRHPSRGTKSLNVLFNYNGHSWDAYEVLGLPAGASEAAVDKAYREVREKTHSQSHEFIDFAYQAIRSRSTRQPEH